MGRGLAVGLCVLLVLSTLQLIGASPSMGEEDETHTWCMFRGDAGRTGLSVSHTDTNKGGLRWASSQRGVAFRSVSLSPAIDVNDTLYVTESPPNRLMAIGTDGRLRWAFDLGDREVKCSTPAVARDGTVYQGAGSTFFAVRQDGTEKWRFEVGDFIWSSPLIDSEGRIYFGSFDDCVYSVYPNGTLRWRFKTEGDVYSSPAMDVDGTIYFVGWDDGEKVFALHQNGSLKWKVPMADPHLLEDVAVGPDGTIYCYDHRDMLYAINPDSTLKWSRSIPHGDPDGSSHMGLLVAIGNNGTIYTGSNDGLYALNPDGTERWRYSRGSEVLTPVVSADETIFFEIDEVLVALDSEGNRHWTFRQYIEEDDTINGHPIIGRDGTIYFYSNSGLYAINGEPESFEILSTGFILPIILLLILMVVVLYLAWRRMKQRG